MQKMNGMRYEFKLLSVIKSAIPSIAIAAFLGSCASTPQGTLNYIAQIDPEKGYVSAVGSDWVEVTNPTLLMGDVNSVPGLAEYLVSDSDPAASRVYSSARTKLDKLAQTTCGEKGLVAATRFDRRSVTEVGPHTEKYPCQSRSEFLVRTVSSSAEWCDEADAYFERNPFVRNDGTPSNLFKTVTVPRDQFPDQDLWRQYRSYVPTDDFKCGMARDAARRVVMEFGAIGSDTNDLEAQIRDAEEKCTDLGFEPNTPEFGNCVLRVSE